MTFTAPLGLALAIAVGLAAEGLAQPPARPIPPYVLAAVSAADRPAADVARDPLRKPAALIAFAGLKPGAQIADIMPGEGYFTRIFSRVVGPRGHVYAMIPAELAQLAPKSLDAPQALAANAGYGNISEIVQPTGLLSTPQPLDMAWTSDNYHDLYGFFGPDQAARFDAAVFKMLKPGGVFMVIDHAAMPGAPDASVKALHRIDPEVVKAQVTGAGFVFDAESPLLANPADPHDVIVFSPAIRGHTDQFVLKFRKPADKPEGAL